jgi:hypothetical protein
MASIESAALFGTVVGNVVGTATTPILAYFKEGKVEPPTTKVLWIIRYLLGLLLVGSVITGFLLYNKPKTMLVVGSSISIVGAFLSSVYCDGFSDLAMEKLDEVKGLIWSKGLSETKRVFEQDKTVLEKSQKDFMRATLFFLVLGAAVAIAIEVTKAYALTSEEEAIVESFIVMVVMATVNPIVAIVMSLVTSFISWIAFLVAGPCMMVGALICSCDVSDAKDAIDSGADDAIDSAKEKVLETEADKEEARDAESTTVTVKAQPKEAGLRKFLIPILVGDILLLLLLVLCETNGSWGRTGDSTHYGLWGKTCSDTPGQTRCSDFAKWPIGGSLDNDFDSEWNWDTSISPNSDKDYKYSAILEAARVFYSFFWVFTFAALALALVGVALPNERLSAILQDLHIMLVLTGSVVLGCAGIYFRFRVCDALLVTSDASSVANQTLTSECFYEPDDTNVKPFLHEPSIRDNRCDDKSLGRSWIDFAIACGLCLILALLGVPAYNPKGCITQLIKRWNWKLRVAKKVVAAILKLGSLFLLFVSAVQLGASSMDLYPAVCDQERCRRERGDQGDSAFTNYYHEMEWGMLDVGAMLNAREFDCTIEASSLDTCGKTWYAGGEAFNGCLGAAAAAVIFSQLATSTPSAAPTAGGDPTLAPSAAPSAAPTAVDAPTAVPTNAPTNASKRPRTRKPKGGGYGGDKTGGSKKLPSGVGVGVVTAVALAAVAEVIDTEEPDEVTVEVVGDEGSERLSLARTSSMRVVKSETNQAQATRLFLLTSDQDEDFLSREGAGEKEVDNNATVESLAAAAIATGKQANHVASLRLRLGSVVRTRYKVKGGLRGDETFDDRLREATVHWLRHQDASIDIELHHIIAHAVELENQGSTRTVVLDLNVRPEQMQQVRDLLLNDYDVAIASSLSTAHQAVECSRGSGHDGSELEFTCQYKQITRAKEKTKRETEYVDMRYYEDDPADGSEVPKRPVQQAPPSPASAAAALHRSPYNAAPTGIFAHGTVAREDGDGPPDVAVGGGLRHGVIASPERAPRTRKEAAAALPASPGAIERFLRASEATPIGGGNLERELGLSTSFVPPDDADYDDDGNSNVMHWEM